VKDSRAPLPRRVAAPVGRGRSVGGRPFAWTRLGHKTIEHLQGRQSSRGDAIARLASPHGGSSRPGRGEIGVYSPISCSDNVPERARGGIGRREGLRILWRNPCRFDPCRAHQQYQGFREICLALRLDRFKAAVSGPINEVTSKQINDFIAGLKYPENSDVTGRTRNNYLKSVRVLFSYAKHQRYITRDAIHSACELYAVDKQVPTDPSLLAFFEPWRKWFDENVERVDSIERVFVHHGYGYAGRVDMLAKFS
jgi:hypothetical protein